MNTTLPNNTLISTRDFLRNFSDIITTPKSKAYTVMKHGKPVAKVTPLTDEEAHWLALAQDESIGIEAPTPKKRITLQELREKYSFHGGKDLTSRIDEIVYGIKRD